MFGHVIQPNLEQRTAPVDDEARYGSAWRRVAGEWSALRSALDGVINLLRVIATDAKAQSPRATSELGNTAVELLFAARQLEAAREAGEELLAPATRGLVTWIERPDISGEGATTPRGLKISGGPVQCDTDLLGVYHTYGDAVRPLTANGNGLLLAGPGLAAGGDFEFPRVLFGMPTEARAANFGRDRAEQTLLCLPTDVPAPNRDHYQERLNQTLIRLALELEGRLVVYFASRNSLREGAQGIRKTLERNGILVLAQGIDGRRTTSGARSTGNGVWSCSAAAATGNPISSQHGGRTASSFHACRSRRRAIRSTRRAVSAGMITMGATSCPPQPSACVSRSRGSPGAMRNATPSCSLIAARTAATTAMQRSPPCRAAASCALQWMRSRARSPTGSARRSHHAVSGIERPRQDAILSPAKAMKLMPAKARSCLSLALT